MMVVVGLKKKNPRIALWSGVWNVNPTLATGSWPPNQEEVWYYCWSIDVKLESTPNRHLREAALVHNLRHSSESSLKNLKEKTRGRFRARDFLLSTCSFTVRYRIWFAEMLQSKYLPHLFSDVWISEWKVPSLSIYMWCNVCCSCAAIKSLGSIPLSSPGSTCFVICDSQSWSGRLAVANCFSTGILLGCYRVFRAELEVGCRMRMMMIT